MKDINLATKSELLGQALVVIDSEHKNVTTNTLKIAEYFGKRPADINRRIAGLVKNSRCKIAPSKYIDDRGKDRIYYILDRKKFSIVVLGFTGEQAEVFRIEYVEQFEKQIAELIEWRKSRQDVIEPTKTCNDAIEWLRLELLKEIPESGKPKFLYINIQKSVTKAADGEVIHFSEGYSTAAPKFIKAGSKKVLYRVTDLDVFIGQFESYSNNAQVVTL